MQQHKRILYIGTYERDYPRNVITIAALRRADFEVCEIHEPVWSGVSDKSALIGSPLALIRLGFRLARAYVRLLTRIWKNRTQADLVAVGYIGQSDILVLGPVIRLLRKPILFNPLVTLTDTLIDDRRKVDPNGIVARLIKLIDRLTLRLPDSILVDTRENRDYIVSSFGIAPDRTHIVPVGADETVFVHRNEPQSSCAVSSVNSRTLRVLFYGNMIPLQGVDTIIRAAKLLDLETDVHFTVIGSGQVLPSVMSLADRLSIRNVHFISHVPYTDLPHYITQADVVLGIFGDTGKAGRVVPNKVYQAMAMGAALITRDSPAVRHVLSDDESALLVPAGDPAALAGAIQQLADPSVRCRLGAGARARFLEVASLDVQARALIDAVDAALARSSAIHREAPA